MNEIIYRIAAQALANLETPNFAGQDINELLEAFSYRVLLGNELFPYLQSTLAELSKGEVTLEEHPFFTGIRGINKTYRLCKGNETRYVIIATGKPFIQVKERA